MKHKLIICNWKLNGNKNFIKKYIKYLIKNYFILNLFKLSIAPPIIYIDYISKLIKNYNITLTVQNIDKHIQGAYTGEISIKMIKDFNIKYIILGHSEQIKYHNETLKDIFKKIILLQKYNFVPIICIGENYNEYKNKLSIKTCKKQINYLFKNNNIINNKNIILAYEPIWAINSKNNNKSNLLNIKHITKIIKFIKNYLNKINYNKNIKIIYGGSVNTDNINILINIKNISGLLIGTASWNIKNFIFLLKSIKLK